MGKRKPIDPIPDEFQSYEEAGKFWDTHDTTDYSSIFRTVETDPRQPRPRSMKHGMSTATRRDRSRQSVARELWQCIDRLDYSLYFKQAAPLPQEPMAYQP